MLPALAVLLPALALALLGLRSYKAEQVLSETRFRGSLQSIGDLTATVLEDAASSAIRELVDLARAGAPGDVAVERVRSRHPIVGQVFVLDRHGDFLYPSLSRRRPRTVAPAGLAFSDQPRVPRGGRRLYQLVAVYHRRLKRELEARRLLARAKQREVRGHYAAAYRDFSAVVERSAHLAAQAWFGRARVSLARHRWLDAARAYSVMTQRYPKRQDWAGVSYALIGRLGLFMVSTRCRQAPAPARTGPPAMRPGGASPKRTASPPGKRHAAASATGCPSGLAPPQAEALRLYTDLVYDRLQTEPFRRIFYIDWLRKRIEPPKDPEARRKLAELDASVAVLRVGMRFAAEVGREGAHRIVERAGFRPRALRVRGFRGGKALLVVRSLGAQVVGFVLDQGELVKQLHKQQGRRRLPEGYQVQLRRLPVKPTHAAAPVFVRPLGEVLGDLGLAIYGPARKHTGLFAPGALEYLGMVGGLVLVLLAGLLTIWRGVRHEMELARLKSEFVSNVSHELKTPLTSIRMFGEMLQQELQPDREQRHKYYQIIVAESERLGRLINNVLDFSRMERGTKTYNTEPHSLSELSREAVDTFRHFQEAEEFDLRLVVDAAPEVEVDRDAVIQSLINLLVNAVKYSGTARQVRVRVWDRKAVGPGREAVVEVADDGIGIPRSEQRRIFDDFFRASNAPKGREGTGLGLALVRRHCESLGGRVEVESELGGGARFRMVFPTR